MLLLFVLNINVLFELLFRQKHSRMLMLFLFKLKMKIKMVSVMVISITNSISTKERSKFQWIMSSCSSKYQLKSRRGFRRANFRNYFSDDRMMMSHMITLFLVSFFVSEMIT